MTSENKFPIPFASLGISPRDVAPYSQLETTGTPITPELETEAIRTIQHKIIPIIKALSCPEVISRDTSFTMEHGVWSRNRNLWRHILDYSAKMGDYDYWLHAYHVDGDNQTPVATVIEATTYAPDEIRVVSINNEADELSRIRLGGNVVRTSQELDYVFRVVDYLAEDAPRQALEKGRISPHWMERFELNGIANWRLEENQEGYPTNINKRNGKPNIYELLLWNGIRTVAHVDALGNNPAWTEDVHGDVIYPEHRVIAWRELGNQIPRYYAKEKYPLLYKS
jgi:hypothetical protein